MTDQESYEPLSFRFSETEVWRLQCAVDWMFGYVQGNGGVPDVALMDAAGILRERIKRNQP